MISPEKADKVREKAVAFFAEGLKSSNKIYWWDGQENREDRKKAIEAGSIAAMVPMQAGEPIYQRGVSWQREDPLNPKKWYDKRTQVMRRAENAVAASKLAAGKTRGPQTGQTYFNWATSLYNGGVSTKSTWGNCAEMAAVAGMFAAKHTDRQFIFIVNLPKPGDHAFCVVARTMPDWATVTDMANAPADAMAIDPWLNVSCPVNQYWTEAQKKFRKWAVEGKRIGWSGEGGDKEGWYTPLGAYQTTFGSQRVNYINIDTPR